MITPDMRRDWPGLACTCGGVQNMVSGIQSYVMDGNKVSTGIILSDPERT